MKALRIAAGVVVLLVALAFIGKLFVAQLGAGGAPSGPVGVVLAPPPGFDVVEGGELRRDAAARELAGLLARRAEARLGLHFAATGAELYWLVERHGAATTLTELAASPAGTRVATAWRGSEGELARRLDWAAAHGGLEAPGLPPGDAHNLYH